MVDLLYHKITFYTIYNERGLYMEDEIFELIEKLEDCEEAHNYKISRCFKDKKETYITQNLTAGYEDGEVFFDLNETNFTDNYVPIHFLLESVENINIDKAKISIVFKSGGQILIEAID
jgi:hypothetical protein